MKENMVKFRDACQMIGRTYVSVKHWYKWAETIPPEELPAPLPKLHVTSKRGDAYFRECDIPMLIAFRDALAENAGIMGAYNNSRRGERGRIAQERREMLDFLKL